MFKFKNRLTGGKQKGFTLIELLVVIAIIGILAAVVLVSLNSARERGRDAKRLADLEAVRLALEVYADQNLGVYPADIGSPGLGPDEATFNTVVGVLAADGLISAVPTDPLAGRVYVAQLDLAANATTYLLGADLETSQAACGSDYDAADLENPDVAPLLVCGEAVAGECSGAEADNVDFCVCQGNACS